MVFRKHSGFDRGLVYKIYGKYMGLSHLSKLTPF